VLLLELAAVPPSLTFAESRRNVMARNQMLHTNNLIWPTALTGRCKHHSSFLNIPRVVLPFPVTVAVDAGDNLTDFPPDASSPADSASGAVFNVVGDELPAKNLRTKPFPDERPSFGAPSPDVNFAAETT
jgi:hypothetical protein